MGNRRTFIAAALAASLATRLRAEDATLLDRLKSNYTRCKFYADVSKISVKAMLMTAPSETRIAFAAPGRLCVQEATRGNILAASIVDGDKCWNWSIGKEWREAHGPGSVVAGMHGSAKFLGDSEVMIGALLMGEKFADPDWAPNLVDVRCTSNSSTCESFDALNGKNKLNVTLDAKTGLIRQMVTENGLIHSTADVESFFDIPFDINRIFEAVRSHPDRPMKIQELRGANA